MKFQLLSYDHTRTQSATFPVSYSCVLFVAYQHSYDKCQIEFI
jgi:hypothetical protein